MRKIITVLILVVILSSQSLLLTNAEVKMENKITNK